MSMKGQTFVIMAIIIVIVMVMLKSSLNFVKIIENKRYIESGLERYQFQNVKDELEKTIQISYPNGKNITDNLNEFLKFSRQRFKSRTIELNGLFLEAYFPTIETGIDTRLNVSVLNLLGETINTINLSFSGSGVGQTQTNYTFEDYNILDTNFTFNLQANVYNYTLNITYNTSSENATKIIIIPTEVGKTKYIYYFDIRMVSNKLEQRDILESTVILNESS